MQEKLTIEEQKILLRLAREAMERGVKGEDLPPLDESSLTPSLREEGSSFITLTVHGQLRGCIGSLEPYQSLAEDVREHAVAAALKDPRFPPVSEDELNGIQIEVSRLTRPVPLEYKDADDLLSKLCPHVDGVILRDGRSTGQRSCRRSGRRSQILQSSWTIFVTKWERILICGEGNIWMC